MDNKELVNNIFKVSDQRLSKAEIFYVINILSDLWYAQVQQMKWSIDTDCKEAIDVTLYKIGKNRSEEMKDWK